VFEIQGSRCITAHARRRLADSGGVDELDLILCEFGVVECVFKTLDTKRRQCCHQKDGRMSQV
jgi:hypothetical protein